MECLRAAWFTQGRVVRVGRLKGIWSFNYVGDMPNEGS